MLVLLIEIFKFNFSKNVFDASISFCNLILLLLIKIMSSTNNNLGTIFICTKRGDTYTPRFLLINIYSNFSITNENNNGLNTHPCLIPTFDSIF